jgi:hypothetical protein
VALVDQWQEIEASLPEGWSDARLQLTVADAGRCERAAALLGAAGASRRGNAVRFYSARGGAGAASEGIRRMLRRIDSEGIRGDLELLGSGGPVVVPRTHRQTLVESWERAVAALPGDWSDLYCEVELRSTDDLERAALLMSPLNPARYGSTPGFRFRVARTTGYGAAPEMVERCLARVDEEGIRAEVGILRALSASEHVATQGPVWYVGGGPV